MRWLLLLLVLPALAQAQIYRWVDAKGRVHFSQHPVTADAQAVEVDPQVIERDAATRERNARLERFQEARREEQAQAAQQRQQRRNEQMQNCRELRQQLASMPEGRRYYQDDGQGGRHYYSDEQLDAARLQLRSRLSEQCG